MVLSGCNIVEENNSVCNKNTQKVNIIIKKKRKKKKHSIKSPEFTSMRVQKKIGLRARKGIG